MDSFIESALLSQVISPWVWRVQAVPVQVNGIDSVYGGSHSPSRVSLLNAILRGWLFQKHSSKQAALDGSLKDQLVLFWA